VKADGTFNSCPLFPHHRPLLIRKVFFLLQINCTSTETQVIEATLLQTSHNSLPYADKLQSVVNSLMTFVVCQVLASANRQDEDVMIISECIIGKQKEAYSHDIRHPDRISQPLSQSIKFVSEGPVIHELPDRFMIIRGTNDLLTIS
jgi:hypothetical protein